MRCKAQRICEIIRGRYHRDPLNGDVYMFMSKDQRKVRMIHYERNAYYLHEKSFIKGYKFMKIERKDDVKIAFQDAANSSTLLYLDNELIDVEHLCCLAHARAKFKYAYDQGNLQTRIFFELIAFSPPANPEESRSELVSKALNYLKTYWNQIVAYRNDGEYSIDNLPAERTLRPVTVQRKNSLFFGSLKGIQNSAIYNTFIETCKQAGVSFRDYFCKLLRELKKGRTDYENLLPMTICK